LHSRPLVRGGLLGGGGALDAVQSQAFGQKKSVLGCPRGSDLETCLAVKEEVEDEGGILIPELASAQALRDLLLKEAAQPFKLMRGPLLRVKLIQVGPLHSTYLLVRGRGLVKRMNRCKRGRQFVLLGHLCTSP